MGSNRDSYRLFLTVCIRDSRYFDTLSPDGRLKSIVSFIEGILRLSTKYFITGLRGKCISIFTRRMVTTLDDLDRIYFPFNPISTEELNDLIEVVMRAIILAQDMSITDGLPFLYYLVAIHISPERLLLNSEAELSWRDKTICMVAREKLRLTWKESYAWLHNFTPSPDCRRRQDCRTAQGLHSLWSLVEILVQKHPLLRFDKWNSLGVCQLCQDKAMTQYTVARSHLWDTLPGLFNLQGHKS